MKKLIAIAALVASVASTQAGTVAWNISGVTKDSTLLTSGLNYMFFAASAEAAQSQIADIIASAGKGAATVEAALSASPWHDTKKATEAGAFSIGVSAEAGGYNPLPSNEDLSLANKTKYYAYAVIFDTETITDDSHFIVAQGTATQYGLKTKDAGTQTATYDLGNQAGATWYAVSDVPEPTSGLLLLLGVAGLALKRKRA